MKKKSKSHVVQLKERVKERIKGKGEAPSSTSQTKLPADSDVPPVEWAHGEPDFSVTKPVPRSIGASFSQPSFAPDRMKEACKLGWSQPFLPVEHHGTVNDLARQVIFSKVKKQDS